jgi:drug/metabolite transporter (DMT)-like permease
MDRRIIYAAYPCFVLSASAVNFLAKVGSETMSPYSLNGLRLAIAGVVLFGIAIASRVSLSPSASPEAGVWKYVVAGLCLLAIPQALVFRALGGNATPNTAAFAESTVPGIVLIYLFAEKRWRLDWKAVFCILGALAGLAVFLYTEPVSTSKRDAHIDMALIVIASAVTAFGMVCSAKLPRSPSHEVSSKLRNSVRNNLYMTGIASSATLVCVAVLEPSALVPTVMWPWWTIVALALVGTCLGWISFVLLAAEDVLLASSAVIAIPVVTVLVSAGLGKRLSVGQVLSAAAVLVALGTLIALELRGTNRKTSPHPVSPRA